MVMRNDLHQSSDVDTDITATPSSSWPVIYLEYSTALVTISSVWYFHFVLWNTIVGKKTLPCDNLFTSLVKYYNSLSTMSYDDGGI